MKKLDRLGIESKTKTDKGYPCPFSRLVYFETDQNLGLSLLVFCANIGHEVEDVKVFLAVDDKCLTSREEEVVYYVSRHRDVITHNEGVFLSRLIFAILNGFGKPSERLVLPNHIVGGHNFVADGG